VTSAGEGLRRGRVVTPRLLPASSSSSAAIPPPAAAAALPLSLVPILAVVDVAGSAIVPAVAPLLVQRSRDFQDGGGAGGGGGGETIDLSTKGRRSRPKDDVAGDCEEAMPLIKVPRRGTTGHDDDVDHQTTPLNLSVPRDQPRDPEPPRDSAESSSPYRIICEWDATATAAAAENSSPATDPGDAAGSESAAGGGGDAASASQILLLSGKQYEIMPLGDGRWISRNEYELQRGLQKSSSDAGTARSSSENGSSGGSADELPSPPASSSAAATAAEMAGNNVIILVIVICIWCSLVWPF